MKIDTLTIVKFWGIFALFVLAGLFLFEGFSAIITILLSFFIAIMLYRPVQKLDKITKSRTVSASLLVFGLLLFIILSITFIIPFFASEIEQMLKSLPSNIGALLNPTSPFTGFLNSIGFSAGLEQVVKSIQDFIGAIGPEAAKMIFSGFSGLFNGLTNVFIVIMMIFFTLLEGPHLVQKFWTLLSHNAQDEQRWRTIASHGVNSVAGYVYGTVLLGIGNAIIAMVLFSILSIIFGIPAILLIPIGLLIFISAFIPMFGSFVGLIFVTLLVVLYNPLAALIFLIIFLIIELLVNNILVPQVFKKTVNLSPLTTMVAMTIGAALLGMLGLLICIPVASVIQIFIKDHFARRQFARLETEE